MARSTFFQRYNCILLILCITSVLSSPITTDLQIRQPSTTDLETRQSLNCNDLAAPFDSSCWGTSGLNVPDFLRRWKQNTPTCQGVYSTNATENTTACCTQQESWSICFLRIAYRKSGYDCSEINLGSCTWTLANIQGTTNVGPTNYALRNIYCKSFSQRMSLR